MWLLNLICDRIHGNDIICFKSYIGTRLVTIYNIPFSPISLQGTRLSKQKKSLQFHCISKPL